ncbi:hypothetical protein H6F77_03165 [Microcoleus sp. FACHB-831]|uniref:hypothetical protein n=1 Tax=Microcoleus sp. FACHB-831 TaxID=2692827 RepID=UPI001689400B|nr:hypothetical protein [Microcoleus sp. FACHB-831]MBD1920117.1 hypothetical protein [Microcoleus sp. FACHB-831]
MDNIIYPTVDLFLYDLGEGLGQPTTNITSNRRRFCQKIYPDLEKTDAKAFLDKLEEAEKSDKDFLPLGGIALASDLDGYYYPLLLRDTYALHVDFSGSKTNKEDEPQPIKNLADLKQIILSKIDPQPDAGKWRGTIGETWLIWGQLTDAQQNSKQVAEECYKQLAPKAEGIISKANQLLGGTLYEFNQHSSSQETSHILVWLFPPGEDLKLLKTKVSEVYFDFIRLFCYRNKINWAYRESRQIKEDLKDKYRLGRESIINFTKQTNSHSYSLDTLRENLTDNLDAISNYTDSLIRLNAQSVTIKVNLDNYRKRLKMLAKKDDNNLLKSLAEFRNYALEKYLSQIESDSANLTPGLTLLENLIRTIQGIIDIEQTKSDRALNYTIAIASFGLGLSGVTATIISTQLASPKDPPEKINPISQSYAFGWSIAPLAIAAIIWGVRRFLRPR